MRARLGMALLALAIWPAPPLSAQQAAPDSIEAPGLSSDRSGAAGSGRGALLVETPSGLSALPILTIDPQALFLHSAWGQRVNDSISAESKKIEAENDRLADQFSREEQELTSLRGTLPADEFRRRADEFDKRVVEVRRQRDGLLRTLDARFEAERNAFFRAALPVLAQLMKERGAQVVLDQSAIFVATQAVDVTDDLVARVDSEIGAGPIEPTPDAGTTAPADGAAPATATPDATATPGGGQSQPGVVSRP